MNTSGGNGHGTSVHRQSARIHGGAKIQGAVSGFFHGHRLVIIHGSPRYGVPVGIHFNGVLARGGNLSGNIRRHASAILEDTAVKRQTAGAEGGVISHFKRAAAQDHLSGIVGIGRIDGQLGVAGLFQITVAFQRAAPCRGIPYIIRRIRLHHDNRGRDGAINGHRLRGAAANVSHDDSGIIIVNAVVLPRGSGGSSGGPDSVAPLPFKQSHLRHHQGKLAVPRAPGTQKIVAQDKGTGRNSGDGARADQVIGTLRPGHAVYRSLPQKQFAVHGQRSGHIKQRRAGSRKSGEIQEGRVSQRQVSRNRAGRAQRQTASSGNTKSSTIHVQGTRGGKSHIGKLRGGVYRQAR